MDSSDACNEIAFNIGSGTSTVNRSWRIKVCNIHVLSSSILIHKMNTKDFFHFLDHPI